MITPYLPVYRRSAIVMVRGEGAQLFDDSDKRYLDFAAGIAVNALGHCHPHLVAALKAQAETLWHCSNLYRIPQMERLATRLVECSFADTVFFGSSGAEAVECGLKMLRRYHATSGSNRYRVIVMDGGFHGRSLATISAGGTDAARQGYAPLVEGFDRVPFGDAQAVRDAVTPLTGGILVEPVQAEGGMRVASPEYLRALRSIADEHGLVLFYDEVQTGMGRTGKLFAYEHSGAKPDILATAKGIGGGFPLSACLATENVAQAMTPGSHGSTYGGNPLAMAAGNGMLDVLLGEGFFAQVSAMSGVLRKGLEDAAHAYPHILGEVRGQGLLLGIVARVQHRILMEKLQEKGLLTAAATCDNVLRFTPPLIITEREIAEALSILRNVCEAWK